MKKSTKKALIISAAAAAGTAALVGIYKATAKYLIRIALDREVPKGVAKRQEQLIASKEQDETVKAAIEAAKELEALETERIEITSHDGTKLVGHWYCPENPKRVIVAMHGWRSSWTQDFGMISPFWHENDCAVIYAEQRGQGTSGGDYMGFGILERYDCYEWVRWANGKTEAKYPIYLAGISMGASTVLMTSGFNLPENVKGIMADCGFTSPKAIWKHVIESNFHIPYGLFGATTDELFKKRLTVGADSYSCTDALKHCKTPALFVHGTDDRFVPIEMTYENYKACASEKHLLVVPGAEHGLSYLIDTDRYQKSVLKFWDRYDR